MKLKADGDFHYRAVKNRKLMDDPLYLITFSPDGKTIAVSSGNDELTLWVAGF